MYEGTRKTAPSTKNSPGALNMKAGEKLVSTILAASTACQDSRLGTNSVLGYFSPDVRADGFGATCSQLGLFPGAASTEGCRTFFVRERHCTVPNYWSEQLIARNKTEKSSDELPIDQEYRPGGRAERTVSSWPRGVSSPSATLSLVKSVFRLFCSLFLRKGLF